MTSETIAKALGGRREGTNWVARCPAHDDRTPSLALCDTDEGKVLFHCYAGCAQAEVIAKLQSKGLWTHNEPRPWRNMPSCRPPKLIEPNPDAIKKADFAFRIWQAAKPPEGTLVETYLRSRGLLLPPTPALRFHPGLPHPSGGIWPAIIALVTDSVNGTPRAIHRTFLAPDGSGKALVDPQKMMLGSCRGGVVRLGKPSNVLMVGEGIETCLSVQQVTGTPAWAALSASGLRSLNMPPSIKHLTLLTDGDKVGESAAHACAKQSRREGRTVRIARPPTGIDFNDMLMDAQR